MNLIADEKLYDELLLILKMFFDKNELENNQTTISLNYNLFEDVLNTNILISTNEKEYFNSYNLTFEEQQNLKKYILRYTKISLYKALCDYTGKTLPWGSLTGIRPSKLYYELLEQNENNFDIASKILKEEVKITE